MKAIVLLFVFLLSFPSYAHPIGNWVGSYKHTLITYDEHGNSKSEITVCDYRIQLTTKSFTQYANNCDRVNFLLDPGLTFVISNSQLVFNGAVIGRIDDNGANIEINNSSYNFNEQYLFNPDGSIGYLSHAQVLADGRVSHEMSIVGHLSLRL